MTKNAVFTMKLEPELRDAFMAAAAASHRPASQIMRELIREFVAKQEEAGDYKEYLARKVARARESIAKGRYATQEEVEARFAALRAEVKARP
jgi:predicted transcriptional regulator